ncbi:MAG: prolipoprotein diacylglyceryl transferase [Chloroflexi bacterium]|nr:prolipoprotein diacylglyceryl transferase [Chloroflexota bacterium]
MQNKLDSLEDRLGFGIYWLIIGLALLIVGVIFINHLVTRTTPEATAVSIFGLPVFWYGIFIMGGIALGAYVVSRLARDRAEAVFNEIVPQNVQDRPLDSLGLSKNIQKKLVDHHYETVGKLLLQWGFGSGNLPLDKKETAVVAKKLRQADGVKKEWLFDAPWRQWNPDHVWNGLIVVLIFAVIGARLYHVLTPSPSMAAVGIESPLDYFRNPAMLINLRAGGLGIYGGMAGGALGAWIYARRHKLSLLDWTDISVVGVALGQVFGRWGNFFNQELYGRPSNLPWAITIDPEHRLPAYANVERFHPAFLYESLWSLFAFIVLYVLAKRYSNRLLKGELTALYLIFYAIGRILLETVRLDSRTVSIAGLDLNMAVATFVSIIIAVAAAVWVIVRRKKQSASGGQVSVASK